MKPKQFFYVSNLLLFRIYSIINLGMRNILVVTGGAGFIGSNLISELLKFKKWLEQKRFSSNTVNTYVEVTAFFLRYMNLKNLTEITARTIERFNYDFIFSPKKSVSYQNQCISGIKHLINFKGLAIDTLNIQRPNKDKKLPNILSKQEVKAPNCCLQLRVQSRFLSKDIVRKSLDRIQTIRVFTIEDK